MINFEWPKVFFYSDKKINDNKKFNWSDRTIKFVAQILKDQNIYYNISINCLRLIGYTLCEPFSRYVFVYLRYWLNEINNFPSFNVILENYIISYQIYNTQYWRLKTKPYIKYFMFIYIWVVRQNALQQILRKVTIGTRFKNIKL